MSGASASGPGVPAEGGAASQSSVLRTMEQYPLRKEQRQQLPPQAMPRVARTGGAAESLPSDAVPSAASDCLGVPVYAPTPQLKLDERVNNELARRLYGLMNQQLQARQMDLTRAAQQQQAEERAQAAAMLGRPTRSPTPPPEPAAAHTATRSGRRAGAHASTVAPRQVNTTTASLAPHVHQMDYGATEPVPTAAGVKSMCDVGTSPDPHTTAASDVGELGLVSSIRDRVEQFRFVGSPGLNGMNLVRVKRLKAVPNHNRGLFAGLDGRPHTTRSGHFVVGRGGCEDASRVRSGAWYRLLKRLDGSTDAGGGALGVDGAGVGGDGTAGGVRRRSRHASSDGTGAGGSMTLKTYGSGSHSFMQLLPTSADGTGANHVSAVSPTEHAGHRGSRAGAASSLAADLQRILDERYGRDLTPAEKEDARRRVREYRQKGPKQAGEADPSQNAGEAGASPEAAHHGADGGDGLGEREQSDMWALPSLADHNTDGDGTAGDHAGASADGVVAAGPHSGRHSFDHTMNSLEARKYGGAVHHGQDGNVGKDANGGNGPLQHDTDPAHKAYSATSLGGEDSSRPTHSRPQTAQSRPSTGSVNHLPHNLSITNLLTPTGRPSTALAPSAGGQTVQGGRLQSSSAEGDPSQGSSSSVAGAATDGDTASPKGRGSRKSRGSTGKSSTGAKASPALDQIDALTDSDNDEALDLFLAHFPETEEHVMLRKQANGFLADFQDLEDFGWATPSDDEGLTDAEREAQRRRRQRQFNKRKNGGEDGEEGGDEADEPLVGFELDQARLRSKFRTEADEEYNELVALRDQLLEEVRSQRGLIADFQSDVYHLSKGKDGVLTGDKFAIQLTKEVNAYAKAHHLRLNDIDLSAGMHSLEEVAEGFLDHFGKEKSTRRNVATQVTDKDLGYADEGVRSAEAMLEDLVFHERGLMESIRLATVAIANIMSFHASLELESTCKECFYLFENPRTLWPCGHTFCQQCLSGMYNRNDELICAECGSICEVGYTPNLSVELVSNYQTVQEAAESPFSASTGNTASHGGRAHGTIELVLRRLLNDLLTVQRNYSGADVPMLGSTPT